MPINSNEYDQYLADIANGNISMDTPIVQEVLGKMRTEVAQNWEAIKKCPEVLMDLSLAIVAINQSGEAINFIPQTILHSDPKLFLDSVDNTKLDYSYWLSLVRAEKTNVQFLPAHDKLILSFEKRKELQEAAVRYHNDALSFISLEERTEKLCQVAVGSNPNAIRFLVPYEEKTQLTKSEFINLCNTAVSRSGAAIEYIPDSFKNYELWRNALAHNKKGLIDLQKFCNGENTTKITEPQFKQLCVVAVTEFPSAVKYLPDKYRNYNFLKWLVEKSSDCFIPIYRKNSQEFKLSEDELNQLAKSAFEKNVANLVYLPLEEQHMHNYAKALAVNGMFLNTALESPGWSFFSQKQQNELIDIAIKKHPKALKFIDEQDRRMIIERIGISYLLRKDFSILTLFPNKEEYQDEINKLLAETEHLVVSINYYDDREIADFIGIYSNHPKRVGKTILLDLSESGQEELDELLKRMEQLNQKRINLVLLDHVSPTSSLICNMDVMDITELLINHAKINRVTLLGCHSARVQKLGEEFQPFQSATEFPILHNPCGLLIMSAKPEDDRLEKLLKIIASDKDQHKAQEGLILIKGAKENQLIYLRINIDNSLSVDSVNLNDAQLNNLGQELGNKNHVFPYPRSKRIGLDFVIYKGGKTAPFLTNEQLNSLNNILQLDMASLNEPNSYSLAKSRYPFFRQATLRSEEFNKLLPSLQKQLIDSIEKEPQLTRSIEVKGYLRVMHADLKEQRIKSGDYSYTNEYKTAVIPSVVFNEQQDNIDRSKLEEFYRNQLKQFRNSDANDENAPSNYKAITYTTSKK